MQSHSILFFVMSKNKQTNNKINIITTILLVSLGARVLSAESVPIWMMNRSGGIVQTQPDSPYSTTGGRWGSNWLIGLRVFVDGVYQDPPPEALPPVPAVQPGENCCNIL